MGQKKSPHRSNSGRSSVLGWSATRGCHEICALRCTCLSSLASKFFSRANKSLAGSKNFAIEKYSSVKLPSMYGFYFLYIRVKLFRPRRRWSLIPRYRSAVFEFVCAENRGGGAAVRAKITRNVAPAFKTTDTELGGDGSATNKTPNGLIIDLTVPRQSPRR